MCNYHVQTVKRHILAQTATCAVHLCVRACVCVRLSAKTAPLLVFSVEMPHLWICTVYGKKKLPCTVRFTPDRLSKTEVKWLSNGY